MEQEVTPAVSEPIDETPTEAVEAPPTEELSEEAVEALADEFLALQQEVPELESIEQVPETVLETAAKQNISLFDAYLRYRFYEQQAIIAEQQRRERAAACSAGSLQTGALRAAPVSDAFARAFEKALS